jgi:hypothetical protein
MSALPQFAERYLQHPLPFRTPAELGYAAGALLLVGALGFWLIKRGPNAEQREAARRQRLAGRGRIVDGMVTDATPTEREPAIILYEYRIAGVAYQCGQDVSRLSQYVRELRVGMPAQVRYDPYNPANSIVVAETWNGLWHTQLQNRASAMRDAEARGVEQPEPAAESSPLQR